MHGCTQKKLLQEVANGLGHVPVYRCHSSSTSSSTSNQLKCSNSNTNYSRDANPIPVEALPPPPQIELVVDKPHLLGVLRRPIVRIRPATSTEVSARRKNRHSIENNTTKVKGEAAVAIIKKSAQDNNAEPKGSLACALPWGHGWGWATLPNGIWSGAYYNPMAARAAFPAFAPTAGSGSSVQQQQQHQLAALTWSQCEDSITLHALPTTHCTNMIETPCAGGIYHTDIGPFDLHGIEDVGGEDFDYAMDCGDFIF
ncbi:hypothetical protein AND_006012 [Anopheles darlingi]|uniref:Uncharacterized protein n=1 Tax=Anopheles darlingi TaxID=43151 RepID=W5JG32_ANODA|nr:hypothetical protein AND_006012 [Anopheles darlingi]